jgi:hypothetical protein
MTQMLEDRNFGWPQQAGRFRGTAQAGRSQGAQNK